MADSDADALVACTYNAMIYYYSDCYTYIFLFVLIAANILCDARSIVSSVIVMKIFLYSYYYCFLVVLVFLSFLTAYTHSFSSLNPFDPSKARIAIDYGPRLIGIASSDILMHVQPKITIANTGDLIQISREIIKYVKSYGASEVLIGLPLDSNGKMSYNVRNFNGKLCLHFASVYSCIQKIEWPRGKVLLVDERYTTKEAKFRLKSVRHGKS